MSLRAFLRGWQFVWVYDIECPNEIPSDYKAYRKQQRRWSCGPMQLWAAAREQVLASTLPPLHKAYLNIFFFGARMLATNIISFTFYSVLVPLTLLHYAQEAEVQDSHHRFMPWWSIVWLPLLVTMSTMAFSPESFHFMILYVMFENAMSILKLGASLEGLLGLKGSMTWTVTQKLGANADRSLSFSKLLKQISCFGKEMLCGLFLIGVAIYGYSIGTSWVFTLYFSVQGSIFLVFSLSLVEAVNLQPPPDWQLLGLEPPVAPEATSTADQGTPPPKKKKSKSKKAKKKRGYDSVALGHSDEDSDAELDDLETGRTGDRVSQRRVRNTAPSILRVLYANVVIFLYTLPLNALSIALLYGVTTMALSEMTHTQWDDIVALILALVLMPGHMFICLGNPSRNIDQRKLARKGKLALSVVLRQHAQLFVLYALLFILFLVSMYSTSATLQQYVSGRVFAFTGKWLEEYID